ncbi:hypothetical protein BC351_05020 [Paenibacillus ferrarius]|uniref:Uncharacterized protein n=1 Tax=Paenibacillus ferrarius TaxID=1469647 RepID=A0A1V4HMB4_9BACL|nr:hypothetical protein [Paenibacillus ferrarius]OPH57854.1 hypothetical protein BC351_05020 [Paenibacillus ferrarius]
MMMNKKWLKAPLLSVATLAFFLTGAAAAWADTYENPNVNGYSTTNTYISSYNLNYGTTANNSIVDFWNFSNDANTTHTVTFWVDTPGAIGTFYIQDITKNSSVLSPFFTQGNIAPGGQSYSITLIPNHQYSLQIPPNGPSSYNYHFKIN